MGWETYDEDMRRDFDQTVSQTEAKGGAICSSCGAKMQPDYSRMLFHCSTCEEKASAGCSHTRTKKMWDTDDRGYLIAVFVCEDCGEEVG